MFDRKVSSALVMKALNKKIKDIKLVIFYILVLFSFDKFELVFSDHTRDG